MLTAFQASTGAYMTEDGELLCESCFESEDLYAKPVSNYGLDEWANEQAIDYEWPEDYDPDDDEPHRETSHADCVPALYDLNGHELVEEYHEHPEPEPEPEDEDNYVHATGTGQGGREDHRNLTHSEADRLPPLSG